MDKEVLCTWIKGYEGLYYITTDGKIFSNYSNVYLSPVKDSHGYLQIGLTKDKIRNRFLVSRLVAEAFIDNPENKPLVCHKDDNPLNNKVDNLFWGTYRENTQDMIRKGRRVSGAPKQMISIVCLETGEIFKSITEASERLNVSDSCIRRFLKGKRLSVKGLTFEVFVDRALDKLLEDDND